MIHFVVYMDTFWFYFILIGIPAIFLLLSAVVFFGYLYVVFHFVRILKKKWSDRSSFDKVVTVLFFVFLLPFVWVLQFLFEASRLFL